MTVTHPTELPCDPTCKHCQGHGFTRFNPICHCVYVTIFFICYRRFRRAAAADAYQRKITFDFVSGGNQAKHITWSRLNEDYIADFTSLARRTLPAHLSLIFRLRFLLNAAPELIQTRATISRRTYYSHLNEIQRTMGHAILNQSPYSLFPPSTYFGTTETDPEPERVHAQPARHSAAVRSA